MAIPILVFDLDNTLILRNDAMLACIEKLFEFRLNNKQRLAIQRKDEEGHSNRINFCKWLKTFLNISITESAIWNLIKNNIGHFVSLNENTLVVLDQLQQKYELALLTNGGIINQQKKIKETGLDRIFPPDRVFISEAIGFTKPDPKAFEWVQEKFPTHSTFTMIGDHWKNDILGALDFGWQAIYLNLNKAPDPLKGLTTISSLSQLNILFE